MCVCACVLTCLRARCVKRTHTHTRAQRTHTHARHTHGHIRARTRVCVCMCVCVGNVCVRVCVCDSVVMETESSMVTSRVAMKGADKVSLLPLSSLRVPSRVSFFLPVVDSVSLAVSPFPSPPLTSLL